MKFANHIMLGFDRFEWDANGDQGASTAVPSCRLMYWCQMARTQSAWKCNSATLLFSGDIKEMLVAIGKSTKRGQKKGLFVMLTRAHDR